jgi:hypothetical protein
MVITSLPSIQLGQHAVLTLSKKGVGGKRLAVSGLWDYEQGETGDRMIGWGLYFQVSGLGHQEPGSGHQVQVRGRD